MYIASVIDIINLIFFFMLLLLSLSNARLLFGRKYVVSKLLFLHSALSVVMASMFIILQAQWSIENFGSKFDDLTNLGWSLFETINSLSLLAYGVATRVFVQIGDKAENAIEKALEIKPH